MNRKVLIQGLILTALLPLGLFANQENRTEQEEKAIVLTNANNFGVDNETLQVPVTATLSNNVLNIQFTGSVPMATVTVSNAMTGATISQQSLPATAGTVTSVPVSGLSMGTVMVTNQMSGESVSGEFVVADGQE